MNSFAMRTGIISDTSEEALTVSFNYENERHCAFAFKSVCYVGEYQCTNPAAEFEIGSRVDFSAVLDPTSFLPHVWKVVSAWTEKKTINAFDIEEWDEEVAGIYAKKIHCFKKWQGLYTTTKPSDEDLCTVNTERRSFDLDLNLERKALKHAKKKINESSASFRLIDEFSLFSIFSNLESEVLVYIWSTYPQFRTFFLLHSTVFNISDDGIIFTVCSSRQFNVYLYKTLPEQLEGCSLSQTLSSMQEVSLGRTQCICKESLAIFHVVQVLRKRLTTHGAAFSINSEDLEQCINEIPYMFRTYIRRHYTSLTQFIEYHSPVFRTSARSRKIYPRSERKVEVYVNDALPQLLEDIIYAEMKVNSSQYSSVNDNCSNSEREEGQTNSGYPENDGNDKSFYYEAKSYLTSTPSFSMKRFLISKLPSDSNEGVFDEPHAFSEIESSDENTTGKDYQSFSSLCENDGGLTWRVQGTSKDASTQTESTGPILSMARIILM